MKNITWLTIPALIIVLAFSFFYFKNYTKQIESTQPQNNQPKEATVSQDLQKTFHIEIVNKKLQGSQENIQVKAGDGVILMIKSDEDEEFHLHGYDKSVDLVKNKEVELQFKADITGHFSYELEKSKTDIGAIEVLP